MPSSAGPRRPRASSSPSASAAMASSTRRLPDSTWPRGSWTASPPPTSRSSTLDASRTAPRRCTTPARMPSDLTIGEVRVILADIPVKRPHKMSFTTLHAVNFAFVRIETRGGLVGWGEAACLGGPTWSEESSESVQSVIDRYITPWLVGRDAAQIEVLRREMARRGQGHPFARPAVGMALWDLNGRALGVPVHRLLGGRVRDRVPLSWSLAVTSPDAEIEEAREKVARGHRIFKIKTAANPVAHDVERVRRIREAVGPDISLRVDANQGWDRPTALAAIRALEPYSLDFVEQPEIGRAHV